MTHFARDLSRLAMEKLMFSLKLNLLFPSLKQVKDFTKRLNQPRHSDADPRELHRMRMELEAAREKARLMNVINRNRIF
jgi:hypothetical protein